ncbi:MAG: S-layer protein [Methanospirillum sp.]|uniref:COG1361 S-layer family protein n=1 Tax=Methanospirillum sp. TaxID=45200 RepID=UPI0023714DFB|nr:S-layer protein [Methanospirillum sp.]MDD1728155.1 S-layer protein [Methanospirillum sp.]
MKSFLQPIMTPFKRSEPEQSRKISSGITASGTVLMLVIASLVLTACIASPALAGTKYMSGSPTLTVSIVGNNEFTPGTTVPLKLQVQNSGLNEIKFVQTGIIDTEDNPSTAKMVTVSLLSGNSPALIKSDPQMIGDIKGSQSIPATFEVLIPDDAKAGEYNLPVELNYTYLQNAEQQGTDSVTYRYVDKKVTFDLPFIIQSAINIDITDVKTENINAGGSGFITLTLKNSGTDTGENAVANLSRSGNSPIVPVSSSVYVGTLAPEATVAAKYKVSVSKDAEPQDYPIAVSVVYDNADGETMVTPTQKVGIPVGADVDFTITSDTPEMHPGKKEFVEVTYRNDGSVPVYGAEVRVSAVDPFTSADDLSYLGDLKPGESKVARFGLTVDATADTKLYGLDSEVKYRDALDDSHVSDTIKVPINVVSTEGLAAIVSSPVFIGLIIVLILGGGYYLYEHRRKQQNR